MWARCWCLGLLLIALVLDRPAAAETFEIRNPLVLKRADPDIYRHSDGYYYLTATVPAYNQIELRRATTIQGLSAATPTVIWKAHASGAMASHIWAPELHYIADSWYIYFAAGSSSNVWDIRVYVLSNNTANPMNGSWTERGQIATNGPKSNGSYFALDATTFEHDGMRYLVWAEADPSIDANTVLFIAPMSNPWTLSARGVRISAPEFSWERQGYAVNEGPAVLKRNGRIFVSYSASATDANYCLGLLTASDTSDLLAPSSWSKSNLPVFKSANGVYGPGHNQFTTSADGGVDLLVYHGRDYEEIVGEALDDPNRATRVQPLNWKNDGTPDFGVPLADGTLSVSSPASTAGAGASTGGTGDGGASTARSGTTAGGAPGTVTTSSRVAQTRAAVGGALSTSSVPTRGGASSGGTSWQADSSRVRSTGGSSPSSRIAGNPGGASGYSVASREPITAHRGGASFGASDSSQAGVASSAPEASRENGCSCRFVTRSGAPGTSSLLLFVVAGMFARFGRRR